MKRLLVSFLVIGFILVFSMPSFAEARLDEIQAQLNEGTKHSLGMAYAALKIYVGSEGSNAKVQGLFAQYYLTQENYKGVLQALKAVANHDAKEKETIASRFEKASQAANNTGNIQAAVYLFDEAVFYANPKSPVDDICNTYLALGVRARSKGNTRLAMECLDKAEQYAMNTAQKNRVVNARLAADGISPEGTKIRTASISNSDETSAISQPASFEKQWDKTIPAAEADSKGRLRVIAWQVDDIKANDKYKITVRIKSDVKPVFPVFAYMGNNMKFAAAEGLEYTGIVPENNFKKGTFYEVLIDTKVVEEVYVLVTREVPPQKESELLAKL